MKKNKYGLLVGLYALLMPKVMFSLLPPDEGAGSGAGGAGDGEAISPAISKLFGLVSDDAPPPPDATDKKPGMSLHAAIAEPSDEEKANAKADTDAAKLAADQKAADEKKAADDAAAKKASEEGPPIKVVKKKTQAELDAERAASADRIEAEKRAAAGKEWETGLLDEERDQLDLAREAELQDPVKYKGLAAKTEKFIRDNATKTASDDFDPDDDTYSEWVKKERPALSQSEVRKIERERGARIARTESEVKSVETLDKAFRLVESPRIKAEADAYFAKASTEVMPDDMAKAFIEDNAKAAAEFPFEYQIVEQAVDAHTSVVESMLALTRINPETRKPLLPYNHADHRHVAAATLINNVDSAFAKHGGAALTRNGRTFLPRAELAKVSAEQRAKYWTFSASEIADRSTAMVKAQVEARIAGEHKRLQSLGFERRAKAVPAAASVKETPAPAPRQGASGGGSGGDAPGSATDRLLQRNGMLP